MEITIIDVDDGYRVHFVNAELEAEVIEMFPTLDDLLDAIEYALEDYT